jgi:hypothetical protein
MPSTDTKPELTAKASMAQPVSQPAVYANGLKSWGMRLLTHLHGALKLLMSGATPPFRLYAFESCKVKI